MKTKILILLTAIFMMQIYLASALIITSVTSNPTEVQSGEQVNLDLTIKNNLNQDAENVVVSLNLNNPTNPIPFAPYQSSNERGVDSISSDDHENFHFNLIALSDAVSGTYTIPVTISYTSGSNDTKQIDNGLVSLIINAKPDIVLSSVGSVLIKGQSGKIAIQVINSGLGTSNFLSVSLESVNGISITSPDKIYIGDINSNDFDTADFNVFVKADAPSTISLPVELTYADSQNNKITQDKTILIKTYTSKEASSLGLISKNNNSLIIILIVLAIIVFFAYRSARKRRRNNKINGK